MLIMNQPTVDEPKVQNVSKSGQKHQHCPKILSATSKKTQALIRQ